MARKIYTIENLDCANCAAKIEAKISALPQVQEAVITFTTRQLRLTAEDPDALIPQLQALARTVEPEVVITEASHHHTEHSQACSHAHHHIHDHEHHHEHTHEHHHEHADREKSELPGILIGAGLFLTGLLTEPFLSPFHIPIYILSYLILGWEVLKTAEKNILHGSVFDENFLMSLATFGAFAIGEFPEAVGVMLFYRLGEFFEHKAVERSRSQIMAAVDLRPEVVTLASGEVIPAGQAQPGDLLLVRPGDRIPLDGVVVTGESRIDTAPITGEPVPVSVKPGSAVTSGCVNTTGQLTVRAAKPLSESMVTRILNSVENAAANKPKMDRFITRFARVYTPIVVGLAAATALIPSLITGDWYYWVYTALSFLVMSCPCALVLSVPLAFFSGIGAGSRKGILFKGGVSIEALAGVKAVVMDKTGTLTRGDFSVQKIVGCQDVLALCAGCEQNSTHPIAQSIVAEAARQNLTLSQPQQLEEISGHGICGTLDGHRVLCGNRRLMARFGIETDAPAEAYGSQVFVAVDGEYRGYLLIADTVKADAKAAVSRLHRQGVATAMLTGDQTESAEAVARGLGIGSVHAQLLPDQKLEQLRSIRGQQGPTLFVGDGINDAPVLAGADVGAAMGSGADAAIEAADVVFMTSAASSIPDALDIARKTHSIAWQNVVFALAVKLIVMVLGLMGSASMWAAVFADSGVAMLCVLNSIRMLNRRS